MVTSFRGLASSASLITFIFLTACTSDPVRPGDDGGTPFEDAGSPPDGGAADGGDSGVPDAGPSACAPDALPPLDEGAWDPGFTIAGFTGPDGLVPTVHDFATDSDGTLLAAGRFSYIGSDPAPPLARMKDGAWSAAREAFPLPLPAAGFAAVAVGPTGDVALATADVFGAREGEIWLDDGSGLKAIGHFTGMVRTLVWFGGDLWVAGNFTLTETPAAAGLAVWNGVTWSAPSGGAADGPVYELVVDGTSLWVGGAFSNIGGISARRIAEWNGVTWQAHDLGIAEGTVYAIARDASGNLYVGGPMFEDPTTGLGGIARFDGTTWSLLGKGVSNGFIPGVVSDILIDGGKVYVSGCFQSANGTMMDPGAVLSRSFARWDGAAWEALNDESRGVGSSWFTPLACGDEGPDAVWDMEYQRLHKHGNLIYLGGAFAGVDGVASQSVVAFDGEKFLPQGEGGNGVSGTFADFAVGGPDCAVYGVGNVTHFGGEAGAVGVARFVNGWERVGNPLPDGVECTEIEVTRAGEVYLGCTDFAAFDGRVFQLKDGAWTAVGAAFEGALVTDLALDPEGGLWVAGGGATGFVARLDGASFTMVEQGFDAIVFELAFKPKSEQGEKTQYVVGGVFGHVSGVAANRIALWNGDAWEALGAGLSSMPSALEFGTTGIYAATQDEGTPGRVTLGRWNGTGWTELARPENGLPAPMGESVHTFLRIREVGTQLVTAGYVWPETGGRNVFVFDGNQFTAIGGGVNAIDVAALAITKDGLWFGGTIADTGSGNDRRPSVGVAHYRWNAAP